MHQCLVVVLRQFFSGHGDFVCRCVHQQPQYKNGGILLVCKFLVTTWIFQADVDVVHLLGTVVQVSVRSYRNGGVVSLSVLEVPGHLHLYHNEVVGGQLWLVKVFCTVFP